MFNRGIIGTCLATFFSGLSATLQKKESMQYSDRFLALVYQYGFVVMRSCIFMGIYIYHTGDVLIPAIAWYHRLLLIAVSIIGYTGVACIFNAYRHMHGGVVLIVTSISVFFMYFINIALFPGVEVLSLPKIGAALLFFVILMQFIAKRTNDELGHTHFINKYTRYALGSALCSTFFTTGSNYLIKTGTLGPFHILLFTEIFIFVIALIWYFMGAKGTVVGLKTGITKRDGVTFTTIGLCGAVAGSLYYYAYQTNPANLINFVKLFSIITAATLCRIFLKDRLNKKQICRLIAAIAVLIAFLLVE